MVEVSYPHDMTTTTTTTDRHGNRLALEGCDRCPCGAKYWERDACVSCGRPFDPADRDEDMVAYAAETTPAEHCPAPHAILAAHRARITWETTVGEAIAAMTERTPGGSYATARFVWRDLGALAKALYESTLRP